MPKVFPWNNPNQLFGFLRDCFIIDILSDYFLVLFTKNCKFTALINFLLAKVMENDNVIIAGVLEKDSIFASRLLNSLPGIFYLYENVNDKIFLKKWNNNHVTELGYSDEELYNMDGSKFFSKKEYRKIEKKIAELFVTGSSQIRTVLITKSGEKLPFFLEGHKFIDGDKTYFMGVGLNISKQKKLEKELVRAERIKQEYLIEKQKVNEQLSKNKREQVGTALQISKTGKTVKLLQKRLQQLVKKYPDNEVSKELSHLLQSLKHEIKPDNNWELFKARFREVHPDFFQKIRARHPAVTKAELRYCAYLRIHMSTSQISTALNVTGEAIRKTRYRIRKKFELPSQASLEEYVSGF